MNKPINKIGVAVIGFTITTGAYIANKSIKYIKDVKNKRGKEKVSPKKDETKKNGDIGENNLKYYLSEYSNVYYNKFVDNKKKEIDAILINNGNIILIEMKNWIGDIYGNDYDKKFIQEKEYYISKYETAIDQKAHKNPIKSLTNKAIILKNTLGIKSYINTLLVFSDDANIENINSYKCSICNLSDINNTIQDISYNKKSILDETIYDISKLAQWDIVKDKNGEELTCIITDKIFEFKLSPEFEDNNLQEIDVKQIKSILVNSQKIFKRNNADEIKVKFKSGDLKTYYSFKKIFNIYDFKNNKNKAISFSKIRYINFSETRPIINFSYN